MAGMQTAFKADRIRRMRAFRIALVKNPATRMHFYVKKEERDMGEDSKLKFSEIFPLEDKDVLAAFKAVEDEEGGDAESTSLPEKALEALRAALTTLSEWKKDFPEGVNAAIAVLAKAVGYGGEEEPIGARANEKAGGEDEEATKLVTAQIQKAYAAMGEALGKLGLATAGAGEADVPAAKSKEGEGKKDEIGADMAAVIDIMGKAMDEVIKEVTG